MSALCWPYVGLTWPYLAPMLALCSPTCTLPCPMLTLCWPQLPPSCPYVDSMFAYVGLGNALPHSSDRNGGGGDGVTTGWERVGRRLGGHASITFGYHRRPPARTRAVAGGAPSSLRNPCFDSMHMGKHDVIYCGISSQTFFPHAKLSSLVVVSTVCPFEEQNTEQEVVTRAHDIRIRRTPA